MLRAVATPPGRGLDVDQQILTNWEKATLVDALRQTYAPPEFFAVLGLSRSSCFHIAHDCWPTISTLVRVVSSRTSSSSNTVATVIVGYVRCQAGSKSPHGDSRAAFDEAGRCGCCQRRRRSYGSYHGEIGSAPDNLINRDFRTASPNKKWLTQLQICRFRPGKVDLSPVIDCFDGLVVSWSISTRLDAKP